MLIWTLVLGCGAPETEDDDDEDVGIVLPDDTGSGGGSGLIVDIETSLGSLAVSLDEDAAPVTVENFLGYVDSGFFDGTDGQGATVIHRVIADFVAQGGGHTEDGQAKTPGPAIALESDNGRSNVRGTIAMARTDDPDSATSQFFFNLVDNDFLDYAGTSSPGYAVFGELVDGLDTLDAIGAVSTDSSDWPTEDIVVLSCERRP